MKPKKKYKTRDRRQQVDTTRLRYGNDHYEKLGEKSASFANKPGLAKLAALKRWHPDWFDKDGVLKQEYADVSNN